MFEDQQIIAQLSRSANALEKIASALEKANALREEQKARSEVKPTKKIFRYPPKQAKTREYPQEEK